MLERMPETRLDLIAADIKSEWGKGIDAQFAVGRLLIEAHRLMPDDRVYGRWFAEQRFPFKKATAFLLQRGSERELEVRSLIQSRVQENERDIGVPYAMQLLTAKPKPAPSILEDEAVPVDPNFASLRDAYNRILHVVEGEPTINGFLAMHADDLAKCGAYIKALAEAYTEARRERVAG